MIKSPVEVSGISNGNREVFLNVPRICHKYRPAQSAVSNQTEQISEDRATFCQTGGPVRLIDLLAQCAIHSKTPGWPSCPLENPMLPSKRCLDHVRFP
jgi:hypothetical protein